MVNVAPALLALAAFLALSPPADWDEPVLIAALAAIAAIAFFAEARLKVGADAFFGATLIVALVALEIGGPLPALAVWVVPDLLSRFVLRELPRVSPGFVATVASYALAVLAGYGILELAAPPSSAATAPALYSAGIAMWAINFAFARLAFAPFYQGYRPAALFRDEFVDLAPAVLAMLGVGVGTALLVEPLGLGALGLLAAVILVPQLALDHLGRAGSVSRLSIAQATDVYGAALADVLGLSRRERRLLAFAGAFTTQGPRTAASAGPGLSLAEVFDALFISFHASERWSGGGWPAGLPAEATPRASRILAVAEAWARLTASGTPELDQDAAVLALAAQAGRAFDPSVVEAAARVVADEEAFARRSDFEPTLHRLRLPRAVRRRALPAVLAGLTGKVAKPAA